MTRTVVEGHIARALAERRYLQPGQVVRLESARLGEIEIGLLAP